MLWCSSSSWPAGGREEPHVGGGSPEAGGAGHSPVKCSVNSCSSLFARSKVFLPCSSVRRLFISLQRKTTSPSRSCARTEWRRFLWSDSHDVLHRFGFDEDGDGVELSQLESLDGVTWHVQDAVFALKQRKENISNRTPPLNEVRAGLKVKGACRHYLLRHLPDRLHAGPVQVVVVLPRLDELVVLDVLLHLLSGDHEVIVSAVHLVVPLRPGRVCGRRQN